jgi:hypothetical protein
MEKVEEGEATQEEIETMRKKIAAEEFEEETPAPVEEIEETGKTEAKSEEETKPDEPEDPWAGINPALRETFDKMSARVTNMDTMAARLKQAESRIGAMQNKLFAAEKAAQEKTSAPTKEEIEKAAAEKESWEELKEEHPEWAEAVDVRFAKTRTEFEERQRALEQSHLLATEQFEAKITSMKDEVGEAVEKTMLTFKHPDWETTIESSEYQEWIKAQPEKMQQKTFSNFAKDAIIVLDEFSKTKTNKTPVEIAAERKKRLEESVSVKGKKAMPVKSEADMDETELRKKIAASVWSE